MRAEEIMAYAERRARAELSQPRNIAAGDVQADDLIYAGTGIWVRVVDTSTLDSGDVAIETTDWTTYKHPRQGIAVKRSEWP